MKTFTPTRNMAPRLEISSPIRGALDFDCAGICRQANEVPCNFLTMDSASHGDVVFALGETELVEDPLPVLCAQHYLRRSYSPDFRKPMLAADGMNGLIYDCCAASCSLSCFYGLYNRATKVLRYVNAGHDAPVLIRSNPDEVNRLETGGPVFGLQESPHYAEGLVQLKTGDRLVAFTQGVIDALAAQNTGSVESVLISLVRKHSSRTSSELVNLIVRQCEDAGSYVQFDGSLFVASVEDAKSSTYAIAAAEAEAVLVET